MVHFIALILGLIVGYFCRVLYVKVRDKYAKR